MKCFLYIILRKLHYFHVFFHLFRDALRLCIVQPFPSNTAGRRSRAGLWRNMGNRFNMRCRALMLDDPFKMSQNFEKLNTSSSEIVDQESVCADRIMLPLNKNRTRFRGLFFGFSAMFCLLRAAMLRRNPK